MKSRSAASAILPPLALALLMGWSILLSEGVYGFRPFMNLEAIILVGLGTLLCLWTAYPLREIYHALKAAISRAGAPDDAEAERYSSILRFAANTSVGLGALTSLLSTILMLASIEDVSQVPRRLALALASLFFSLVLSEIIFMPLSRRVRETAPDAGSHPAHDPLSGGRRHLIALLAAGVPLFSCFTILWALEVALRQSRP